MRDPALLEYVGHGAIQASVFPIPPGEDRRVQIDYRQILTAEMGMSAIVYPLNTERFSAQPLEQVSVRVAVDSADPLRARSTPRPIESPSTGQRLPLRRRLGGEQRPSRHATSTLIYTVATDPSAPTSLSYVDPASGEGYFMLLAAPGIGDEPEVVAKDVIIVLDTSGSMDGEKIVQAKQALVYVLDHLNAEDRFNVIEFSTGRPLLRPALQPASRRRVAATGSRRLPATGGTDINRRAARSHDDGRPPSDRPMSSS